MWVAQPGLLNQMVHFDENGRSELVGLRAGRYRLVAFPSDLTFAPAEFDVLADDTRVAVAWQRQ